MHYKCNYWNFGKSFNISCSSFCHPKEKVIRIQTYTYLINSLITFFTNYCRFGLHLQWSSTVFVLNLAFADLLYCAIELPVIAIHYLHQTWDWGFASCYITASFRYLISYVEWMSIAWIAFTRCILVTNNEYFKSILKAKNRRLLIVSTWIYAVLLLMPTFLEVLTHHPQTYLEINENATSKILYFAR